MSLTIPVRCIRRLLHSCCTFDAPASAATAEVGSVVNQSNQGANVNRRIVVHRPADHTAVGRGMALKMMMTSCIGLFGG